LDGSKRRTGMSRDELHRISGAVVDAEGED
jgi:hypothetical protein